MRAHIITTTELALLLALGALGLVACDGGDDQTTAASETLKADSGSTFCGDFRIAPPGEYPLIKVEVVEGDVPCRVARRVLRDQYREVPVTGRTDPGSWFCSGPESQKVCENETGETIRAHFPNNKGGQAPETTEATLPPEQKIEQLGNKWAPLFAAAHDRAAGKYQTQPLAERITCKRISGPIRNCTPLSSQYRKSFEGATVTNVAITGDKAAARFSNGETVALEKVNIPDPLAEDGDRLGWLIHEVGGSAGAVAFITKVGNAWAALFADDSSAVCGFINGQPLCQRFTGRVGEPPDVGRPSEFQRSFQDATVEHVEVRDAKQIKTKDGTLIGLQKAVAEFSNGELVEFIQEETRQPLFNRLGTWFVDDIPRARRCLRRGSRACRVHFFG